MSDALRRLCPIKKHQTSTELIQAGSVGWRWLVFVVLCVFGVRGRTVTPVPQVGPDDVFLGETEDTEPTSSHAGVDHNTGVGHHVHPLKQLHPETEKGFQSESSSSFDFRHGTC